MGEQLSVGNRRLPCCRRLVATRFLVDRDDVRCKGCQRRWHFRLRPSRVNPEVLWVDWTEAETWRRPRRTG
jgi:hypothetical protein